MPRFRVHCANPSTGEELDWEVECTTLQEAEQRAQAAGLLVSSVSPLSDPVGGAPQPPARPEISAAAPPKRIRYVILGPALFLGLGTVTGLFAWWDESLRGPGVLTAGHSGPAVNALSWVVWVLAVTTLVLFGSYPGMVARERGHRHWQAVFICGIGGLAPVLILGSLGVLLLPVWFGALVWAFASAPPAQA